jgi:hypothetical protein
MVLFSFAAGFGSALAVTSGLPEFNNRLNSDCFFVGSWPVALSFPT